MVEEQVTCLSGQGRVRSSSSEMSRLATQQGRGGRRGGSPINLVWGRVGALFRMNRMTPKKHIFFPRTMYVVDKELHCTLQISPHITAIRNILSPHLP